MMLGEPHLASEKVSGSFSKIHKLDNLRFIIRHLEAGTSVAPIGHGFSAEAHDRYALVRGKDAWGSGSTSHNA